MIAPHSPMRAKSVTVTIPGDPVAQGRGRAVRFGASVRVIDPAKSRSWKGAAQVHMIQARARALVFAPFEGPLVVTVIATWARPKSQPKRNPPVYRTSRPDADNIAKAVLDALHTHPKALADVVAAVKRIA